MMNSPFPFEAMLTFGFLSGLLLIGTLIRAKVPLVQKYLFPSCLIGGLLGSIAVNSGWIDISVSQLEIFAYHFFNISFISAGLTRDTHPGGKRGGNKHFWQGTLWMALTQGITFPVQAIIGGGVVLLLGLFGMDLFDTFGFLAPLGFNEGPGQALSFGKVWEELGFSHAATIGLTFAAVGYAFAFFIGVPLANWGIRKGLSQGRRSMLTRDFIRGYHVSTSQGKEAGRLRLHSANIDSLAFQMALVGVIYLITYFLVQGIGTLVDTDTAKMLWGFYFFFGLLLAVLVRLFLDLIGIGYLVDTGIQKRITGWSVDYLLVATIPAIQFTVVWAFALPIAIISVVNGLLTTLLVFYLGRRLISENLERMLAIFGTVTGTISCGLLLLRIADPEFKTSVTIELAVMNIFVLPIIFGCTVLVNAPLWWDWPLELTLLAFLGVAIISYSIMRLLRLQSKPRF